MSELAEILKNEYKKKEEAKPIDLSMLMEMVEQLYDAIEPEVMGGSPAVIEEGETDRKPVPFPNIKITELWGKTTKS